MPGFELVGKKENKALNDIFKKSNGVLFGHAFDKQRKNIFRVRNFEKLVCKKLKVRLTVGKNLLTGLYSIACSVKFVFCILLYNV